MNHTLVGREVADCVWRYSGGSLRAGIAERKARQVGESVLIRREDVCRRCLGESQQAQLGVAIFVPVERAEVQSSGGDPNEAVLQGGVCGGTDLTFFPMVKVIDEDTKIDNCFQMAAAQCRKSGVEDGG